jgi:hypothetical protein
LKNESLITIIGTAAALVFLITILVWQIKVGVDLKQTFQTAQGKLRSEEDTNVRLERIKARIEELRQREITQNKIVPVNEKQPLGVIKSLVLATTETGMQGCTFKVIEKTEEATSQGEAAQPSPLPPDIKEFFVELSGYGTFPQILSLLGKVKNLERLVLVKKLTIKRDEKKLPVQKVVLELAAYSFVAQ